MSKIKLCGLTRQEDIDCVNRYLPDYVGFVFYKKSHRFVTEDQAAELKSQLDRKIKTVGVFVDEKPENIILLCKKGSIDLIQLHGSEDSEYIDYLRRFTNSPIIKAFKVKGPADIATANTSNADFVLLDTFSPNLVGGTGKLFDHSLLQGMERKYFLAGGVTPDNLSDILNAVNPYCVDLSSGIETERLKDESKIKAVMQIIRRQQNV